MKICRSILIIIILISASIGQAQQNTSSSNNIVDSLEYSVVRWNNLLIIRDLASLKTLYADKVSLYGENVTIDQLISKKKQFFQKYPDFDQDIPGRFYTFFISNDEYRVCFPKNTTYGGKTYLVPGYLIFNNIAGKWKITCESDVYSDNYNHGFSRQ